ncbi:MAG: hypothetical protein MJ252_11190 [archaeon]|nr:hypothetical protein [archaeon]
MDISTPKDRNISLHSEEDKFIKKKVEFLIQQKHNTHIPAVLFEINAEESEKGFDHKDLSAFFSKFGIIEEIFIKNKKAIILYKDFLSAETSINFLSKDRNFKTDKKQHCQIKWMNLNEIKEILTNEEINVFENIIIRNQNFISDFIINQEEHSEEKEEDEKIFESDKDESNIISSLNTSEAQLNNKSQSEIKEDSFISNGFEEKQKNFNNRINNQINPNILGFSLNQMNAFNHSPILMQKFALGPLNPFNLPKFTDRKNKKNNTSSSNYFDNSGMNSYFNYKEKKFTQNKSTEEKTKYTCKYKILIPNEPKFQVVRKIIGKQGCNMKKILDSCTKMNLNKGTNSIKLRLRGKGSGHKEGPQSKESSEPLHLCISAKNKESLNVASMLAEELLNKIYEEYKQYCYNNMITPLPAIAKKMDEDNSYTPKHNTQINLINSNDNFY